MNEQTIFTAALEREPDQRSTFLAEACGSDMGLRERVENLLEVENIVISKIALNKSYKPLLKLDDAISRQLQVICEKVVYDKDERTYNWCQRNPSLLRNLI